MSARSPPVRVRPPLGRVSAGGGLRAVCIVSDALLCPAQATRGQAGSTVGAMPHEVSPGHTGVHRRTDTVPIAARAPAYGDSGSEAGQETTPSLAGASHPQPAAACSALGNCFCMCPGSGCDQQEEGCSVKHGRGLSSMSHLGRTSVRHLDSFPDAHVEGHWQILVWGSALKKRPADTELWGPPAFLQGAPGTSPEHTQARSQPPRSPRAFS